MQELNINKNLANEFALLFHEKNDEEKEMNYIYNITFVLTTENDYIFDTLITNFKYQTTSHFFS